MNARNRSTKSWFIAQLAPQAPQLLTEPPDLKHPIALRDLQPELEIVCVSLLGRLETPHGLGGGATVWLRHATNYVPRSHKLTADARVASVGESRGDSPENLHPSSGRFLMNATADDGVTSPSTIVLNWTAAIKK
jgi:hypothetical protein